MLVTPPSKPSEARQERLPGLQKALGKASKRGSKKNKIPGFEGLEDADLEAQIQDSTGPLQPPPKDTNFGGKSFAQAGKNLDERSLGGVPLGITPRQLAGAGIAGAAAPLLAAGGAVGLPLALGAGAIEGIGGGIAMGGTDGGLGDTLMNAGTGMIPPLLGKAVVGSSLSKEIPYGQFEPPPPAALGGGASAPPLSPPPALRNPSLEPPSMRNPSVVQDFVPTQMIPPPKAAPQQGGTMSMKAPALGSAPPPSYVGPPPGPEPSISMTRPGTNAGGSPGLVTPPQNVTPSSSVPQLQPKLQAPPPGAADQFKQLLARSRTDLDAAGILGLAAIALGMGGAAGYSVFGRRGNAADIPNVPLTPPTTPYATQRPTAPEALIR